MTHKITTQGEVRDDRTLVLKLPADFAPGKVEVTVTQEAKARIKKLTAAELADSDFAGDWKDRTDLPSNEAEFSDWRKSLWERKAG